MMQYYQKMEFSPLAEPGAGPIAAAQLLKQGFDGIEVSYVRPFMETWPFADYMNRIKAARDAGSSFTVHGPIIDTNLSSLNEDIRRASVRQLQECVDFAGELGAPLVVVHGVMSVFGLPNGRWNRRDFCPGNSREKTMLSSVRARTVRSLREIADYAPQCRIAVENLVYPHELYRSPQALAALIDDVDRSNVGATIDVGHGWVNGFRGEDYVRALGHRLFHVHLHDNHGEVDEHLPLGQGTVPLDGFFPALKDNGYGGVLNFECHCGPRMLEWVQGTLTAAGR